ncbi:GTP-binding protein LepA [Erythrobacter sp. SD-21]|nr:GTP-binding protein LepA [Erythrobacter sp. SD-21]
MSVVLYASIFGYSQKNYSVYGFLNSTIELSYVKVAIAQRDIARKDCTPTFDLLKKCIIYFGSAAFPSIIRSVFIE